MSSGGLSLFPGVIKQCTSFCPDPLKHREREATHKEAETAWIGGGGHHPVAVRAQNLAPFSVSGAGRLHRARPKEPWATRVLLN